MSGVGQSIYYEKNEIYDELAADEDGIFGSNLRLLVFAATVGYARNRYVHDHGTDGETRWGFIDGDKRLSVIVSSIAYAHEQDPDVILDTDAKVEMLTSFGAGGARILKEEVVDEPGEDIDNIITFMREHRDETEAKEQAGILEEIEENFGSL